MSYREMCARLDAMDNQQVMACWRALTHKESIFPIEARSCGWVELVYSEMYNRGLPMF